MTSIRFGTDGWRAVIADEYTFDNLSRVTFATARWLHETYGASPTVLLGYDTRFLSAAFATHAVRVFTHEGVRVVLAEGVTPTPAISWATREYGCNAGVVITASHNPPEYNGFKIKADFGGPASPDVIARVEGLIPPSYNPAEPLPDLEDQDSAGGARPRDVTQAYLDMLQRQLDMNAIRASGLTVAHDAMYGAGQGLLSRLLGGQHVVELRSTLNPGFGGVAPEPIARNLEGLGEAVVAAGCAAGIANDGDADRIGMVDEGGRFVDSHQLLALLVKYLHTERGLRGDVVKTFSTTHMLDKMGAAYGLRVETTPIGFKHIGTRIVGGDVLVGGEESGGMAVKGHIPERDGIYIGLLILEMMVRRGLKLSELVQELFSEFGPHVCYRSDVQTTVERKDRILRRLVEEGGLETIAGNRVREMRTLDGFKHVTDAGWLLVRPSGTEPVLRVYSEAESMDGARKLVEDALRQLEV